MNLQAVIAWIIVALAALWLVRRTLRLFNGGGAAGGCDGCNRRDQDGTTSTKTTPLVSWDEKE